MPRTIYPDAQTVEKTFADYNISVRVYGGEQLPTALRYRFAVLDVGKLSVVETIADQIALVLGIRSIRVTRPQGYLSIELDFGKKLVVSISKTKIDAVVCPIRTGSGRTKPSTTFPRLHRCASKAMTLQGNSTQVQSGARFANRFSTRLTEPV